MRKLLVLLALLAIQPVCWQPLRGQTPRVGVGGKQTGQARTNGATGQSGPNQIGTQARPLVVDTEGHVKTQIETANAEKEAKRASEIARRTLDASEGSARYGFWTTWGTWALVFVGGIGAFFANKTLRAIESQVNLMERQGIASQRAILVPSPHLDDFGVEGKPFVVSVEIRNVGNDPAVHFGSWLMMGVFEGPNFPNANSLPSDVCQPRVVVFPRTNADFRTGAAWDGIQSADFIRNVKSGNYRIYCWGRFEYDSMDSVKGRFVDFCYYTIFEPHVMFTTAEARNDCN